MRLIPFPLIHIFRSQRGRRAAFPMLRKPYGIFSGKGGLFKESENSLPSRQNAPFAFYPRPTQRAHHAQKCKRHAFIRKFLTQILSAYFKIPRVRNSRGNFCGAKRACQPLSFYMSV
ncbi:MAG: hypothetical protein DBX55_04470 [Verrucomicrobia bacterium]|nr:MAG: hypothetical protein DBX55_04470 [Verrucomicrobiota bacterium]